MEIDRPKLKYKIEGTDNAGDDLEQLPLRKLEVDNLRFLCLTVCTGEGSLGGDSPALLTAIVLYWTLSFNERPMCLYVRLSFPVGVLKSSNLSQSFPLSFI